MDPLTARRDGGEQGPGTADSTNRVGRPAQSRETQSPVWSQPLLRSKAHNLGGPSSFTFSSSCLAIYSFLSENSFFFLFLGSENQSKADPSIHTASLKGQQHSSQAGQGWEMPGAHPLPDVGRRCPRRGQSDLKQGCWKTVTPKEPRSPLRVPLHSGKTNRLGQ